MPDSTNITPPRVPFLDSRTGLVTREWYRFFLSLFSVTGGGTGITPIVNGGTNSKAAPTAGGVAYGNGTAYRFSSAGSPGQVLMSNGTLAPSWSTVSGTGTVSSIDVSGGATGLSTFGGPITGSGTITLTGILNVASGGTNSVSTPTAGALAYGTGAGYGFTSVGTAGQPLVSGGGGSPNWTSSLTLTQLTVPDIQSSTSLQFRTTPTTGGVPITALTIDQYRCQIGNSSNVTDGLTGSYSSAINTYFPFITYIDDQSPASAANGIIIGNCYQGGYVDATNTAVTYDRSINFYASGIWEGTGNVTISYRMAFQSDSGDNEFSGVLYVGGGATNPASFQGVRCCLGALGYGANTSGITPGGSVTQFTNKSTAVTIDNPCGQITMNNAALAGGASVSFVMNNVFLASTDTLIANIGPAGTADTYSCTAQITGAGTARIRVTNYSGTSRSEAVKINFAIITATNT